MLGVGANPLSSCERYSVDTHESGSKRPHHHPPRRDPGGYHVGDPGPSRGRGVASHLFMEMLMSPLRSLMLLGTLILSPLMLSAAQPASPLREHDHRRVAPGLHGDRVRPEPAAAGAWTDPVLNDKGVKVASRANAAAFGEQQKLLKELVERGAPPSSCAPCA